MALPPKRWRSGRTSQTDQPLASPLVLYGCHVGTLGLGALVGVFAAAYFGSLNLTFSRKRGGILFDPTTAERLKGISRFLQENTTPGEYTYFFPNEAGYYVLFNRNNPTRYPCAFHAATRAQRVELIGDLEQKKPKYIFHSLSTAHIDGIPDEIQFPEVVAYLKTKYVLDSEPGDILILKRKGI
jgi:hypothetical protein